MQIGISFYESRNLYLLSLIDNAKSATFDKNSLVICTACIFFIPIQGTGSPRAEWNELNKVLKQVLMNSTIIFGFQHVSQIIAFDL